MLKAFRNFFFPFVILAIVVFISFKSYLPGTWLLGWDNLLPELNFKLNIARSISAVWQEYQGLGLLGGMAHAADLPRQMILWLFSMALPASFLRYLWTFLMLAAGPLGVYFLVGNLLGPVGSSSRSTSSEGFASPAGAQRDSLRFRHPFINYLAGFVSAIFYIFNLATVQTFFTPFETFISFYGFFPWLLFAAISYLMSGKKKNLLIFAVISLLATSAFYVQTMFIVYAVFLVILSLEGIARYGKSGLSRSLKLALVTVFINAFWLGPALYFTATSSQIPAGSHINSIATPETQLMNQARSGFSDVATLKGYWFDYYDWNNSGKYDYLYKDWISYSQNPNVDKVSLALFAVSAVGLILILFKSKKTFGVSFIILFGVSYFMLSGGNLPIPLFSEIFRNVFTKWANAASLVYAVGLGFFVYTVSGIIKNRLKYIPAVIFSGLIVFGSIYTVLPMLQGKLIADSMKVNLPDYYTDTVNYFKNIDPTARVASFPFTDFWGWKFNDWGYRGSGFLWYGLPQPVLDRAFDVWSPYNEKFYEEANYALAWGSVADLERVLDKYQVSYLVFDESAYLPGNPNSSLILQKEKDFLDSSTVISKVNTFGKIAIYKVISPVINNFVSAPATDYSEPIYKIGEMGQLAVSETFPDSQGYPEAKNCNLDGRGSVIKEKQDGGNYYAAEGDGVSCDYFYYPSLDCSKAYAMRISGVNLKGRSLKLYLYNVKTEKIYMDELLPAGAFDKTYTILPTGTSEDTGYGYTLNVETRSFGKMTSANLINKIEFYDLNVTKTEPKAISNDLQIMSVKKYGTWGYGATASGEGLMALGQGYSNGWVAVEMSNDKLQITNVKTLEHTKVNSWANGWLVDSSSCSQLEIGNCKLLIIYWPQALEWGGMLLGLITLSVILTVGKNRLY